MNRLAVDGHIHGAARTPWWRVAAAAGILTAVALSNALSEISDYRHLGEHLPDWQPLVCEFSSVIVIAALIPAIVWLTRRVPFTRHGWYRSLAIHLVATLPFSIIHVAGMVALRRLAYALAGHRYEFGPVLSGWVYEYRKDFVTYAIIVYIYAISAWLYRRKLQTVPMPALAPAVPPAGSDQLDRLVVRKLNREFILDVARIGRIESNGNYVTVYADGSSYQLRNSLAGLSKRLDSRRFVQVHRSQVVNIDHIREIQPWDHGDYRVMLNDGSVVNFSRRYRARLEQLLKLPAAGHSRVSARP